MVGHQDDKRDDRLPGGVVSGADDGRLRHPRVADQCRLHLRGGDSVPGHVHHVVNAAQQPDGAVQVIARAVAGKVPALLGEPGPVSLLVPFRIPPDAAQHRRPRLVQHQITGRVLAELGAGLDQVAVVVDNACGDAG